jgi:hypothetical protein
MKKIAAKIWLFEFRLFIFCNKAANLDKKPQHCRQIIFF